MATILQQLDLVAVERAAAAPDADLAYAAGFFDGEGCVHIARFRTRAKGVSGSAGVAFDVHVVVSNTCRPVLDWFAQRWAGVVYTLKPRGERWQQAYQWRIAGQRAGRFLRDIRPLLMVKGDVADNAIGLLEFKASHPRTGWHTGTSPESLAQQEAFWSRHRELILRAPRARVGPTAP